VFFIAGMNCQARRAQLAQEMDSALEDPKVARDFIPLFRPGIQLQGIEAFLSLKAREYMRAGIAQLEIPPAIRERFARFLFDLRTKS
jgi:hypothetical protein